MEVQDLVGSYLIKGTNQQQDQQTVYKGVLKLSLDSNLRIAAEWIIGQAQQYGSGFFKNDILVLNFHYTTIDQRVFKGVAVYKCIDQNTLDGFWSEKYGDPLYLGTEYATRI